MVLQIRPYTFTTYCKSNGNRKFKRIYLETTIFVYKFIKNEAVLSSSNIRTGWGVEVPVYQR